MSPRLRSALLRCYPPAWRTRYGEELETLIMAGGADGEPMWRTTLDVLMGALREWLRELGLGGEASRGAQARGGVLMVLFSWALLVLGGAGVQRFSEHWQAFAPASSQALPAAAFDALVISGAIGCLLVAAGIAAALPRLIALLLAGGAGDLRRPARRAGVLTLLTGVATVGLVLWAHSLDVSQRNGGSPAYADAFLLWAGLIGLTLLAWASMAARCARRIELDGWLLRLECRLALGVALAALAATTSAALWWAALAEVAPEALHGPPGGPAGGTIAAPLLLETGIMALGTLLAGFGAWRGARGLSARSTR